MAAPKDGQTRQRVESGSHFWQCAQYKVVTANSYLDHQCKLHIEDRPGNVRNTGIICTIGKYVQIIQNLFLVWSCCYFYGMNLRINVKTF